MADTVSDTIGTGRSKADYSQTLSEPSGDFSQGHQGGPPLSQAIGGALSGLADVFSAGMKLRDDDMLKGERVDLTNKLNTYVQANAQGKMTRDEMLARSSTDLVSAVNRVPRFADDLRKTAQENLGLNPQAAQVADAQWQETVVKGARAENYNAAAKAGLLVHNEDGSVDFTKSEAAGEVAQKQVSDQSRYNAWIEGELRKKELDKGAPLTADEKHDIELNTSKDMIEPMWNQTFTSLMSRFDIGMKNVANMPEEKARATMIAGLNKDKLNFQTQLQGWKMNTHMSAKTYTDISAMYDGYFKNIEDSLHGPMSDWAVLHDSMAHLADKTEQKGYQVAPAVMAASKILGPQALAAMVSSKIWQNVGAQSAFGNQITRYLGNVTAMAGGTYSLSNEQDPTTQTNTLAGALQNWGSYVGRSTELQDDEVSAAANIGTDTLRLALSSKNPDDIVAAQQHLASPDSIALLQRIQSDPKQAQKAQIMGAGMYTVNSRALLGTLQKMGPESGASLTDLEGMSKGQASQELGAKNYTAPTFTPVYDPNLGKIVLQHSGDSPGRIDSETQKKVDAANQMLVNITKLKEYGPDQDKALKDSQLKYFVLSAGGIPLKAGTQPPEMPGDKKEPTGVKFKKASADAVKKVESNGNPNAVSPKGARGSMQTMPNTLKDPGFGVTPAKDNSPAEMERVGKDYLHALEKHYDNPTTALAAYNWGPTHVDAWLKKGAHPKDLPQETKDYIIKVMQERFH